MNSLDGPTFHTNQKLSELLGMSGRCLTRGFAGKLWSIDLTTAMNVLGRPSAWRGTTGYPSKSQGSWDFPFIRGQQVQGGKATTEDFQILGQGCEGNGADYGANSVSQFQRLKLQKCLVLVGIPLDS